MRLLSASLIVASLSLWPGVGSTAPAALPQSSPTPAAMLLAQYQPQPPPGWWEQEGRQEELRERYWRLSPPERYRYNQLEAQIRDLWFRQEQLRREQRRILRWGY
jgi:hypothetical protein